MGKSGRKAIPPELVAQVRRVYARTSSMRLTAAKVGLSRTSVQNIVRDRHLKVKSQSQVPRTAPGEVFVVPVRCPNGHLVEILPCRICHQALIKRVERRAALDSLARESAARASGQGSGVRGQDGNPTRERGSEPLCLDLAPSERERFEQIRRGATATLATSLRHGNDH